MRDALRQLIRQPSSGETMETVMLEGVASGDGGLDVREAILIDASSRKAYPVVDGVPVALDDAFTDDFLSRHQAAIARHPKLSALPIKAAPNTDWSFSREWDEHFESRSPRTWGYTVEERLEQLLMEADVSESWFRQKLVLDAGCGNGALSNEISKLGAVTIGMDYSSSVKAAERLRHSGCQSAHFIQGDLQQPALAEGSFDLVFSIGVLHHTPDTYRTFKAVAKLVKPGGKFYVWLYRRPERFLGRYLKVPIYDLARVVMSRMPPRLQDTFVNAYARAVRASHWLRDRHNPIPLREYIVSAYDDLTCRWRHYHTPLEVSRWFHESGFSAPTLTHWDNPYGFGMVATKQMQHATPGIHYGTGVKLWDDAKSLLGQFHRD